MKQSSNPRTHVKTKHGLTYACNGSIEGSKTAPGACETPASLFLTVFQLMLITDKTIMNEEGGIIGGKGAQTRRERETCPSQIMQSSFRQYSPYERLAKSLVPCCLSLGTWLHLFKGLSKKIIVISHGDFNGIELLGRPRTSAVQRRQGDKKN